MYASSVTYLLEHYNYSIYLNIKNYSIYTP